MTRLTIIIILLFVVQEAYPQFNSIEFQKELPTVKVDQSKLVLSKKEGIDKGYFSHVANPIEKESRVLLASLPLEGFLMTSTYGYRSDPFSGERKFHRGIDLNANLSKVYSMLHGKVSSVGHDPLLGNFIKVQHGNYAAVYGHLSQIWVTKNESVLPGSVIGISGSTGKATGDHLHVTIKKGLEYINPTLFIQMLSKLSTKDELIQFLSN
ncbi:M23 family metallopeptidase [Algoriphagus pacificus]|uniref:M23 family metallopeptidase n=1 Tax=Algoriphagus pacificus TaxID=2811234 RepID=A0ABS3CKR5_9BACT|nr:M23 family metallopeptidase [Algoriphagus pacificus]MBN7817657.1 M23 family metallopeptidase [Algoriphagus pacificus]